VPTQQGWEHFEVEADVGVHAWGATLEACFRQCALGVFNLIVPLEAVAPLEPREVSAQAETVEALLVNWVNELLYLHEVEGFAVHDVAEPRIEGGRAYATVMGEPLDVARHPRGIQVKAATFHQLALDQQPGHVEARLVIDI
jgi:SHS2 domain-containing protein